MVIGIVAAIITPMAIAKYNRIVTPVKLKKVYTTLSNAIRKAEVNHGPMESWLIYNYSQSPGSVYFYNSYLKNNINVGRFCDEPYYNRTGGCVRDFKNLRGEKDTEYQGVSDPSFIFADGAFVVYYVYHIGTTPANWYIKTLVDINGVHKGKNTWGKDIFELRIRQFRNPHVVFTGHDDNIKSIINICSKASTGRTCGELIRRNNWKIPTKKEYVELGGIAENYPF